MQQTPIKTFYALLLAIALGAAGGCGGPDGAATNARAAAASNDKWLDAGNVELAYDAQIRMDAINAGKSQFTADKSCEAMLPMAQKALGDSSNVGTDVQLMYKTCSDVGLKFQNKVRCEADRLQVLCR